MAAPLPHEKVKPFFKKLLEFLNPVYHFQRFKEDIALTRRSMKFRHEHSLEDHDMQPEDLLRGRLAAAFFLSGPSGLISIPLGYWVQRHFSSIWLGVIATILIVMLVSSAVYQIIWYHDNKKLYDHVAKGWPRVWEVQRDLWPVHWTGIRTGTILGLVSTYWAAGLVIGLFQWLTPKLAAVLPMNVFVLLADFIFVQGPFLRIMGDFFDRHSRRLANKYAWAFA